MLYVRTKLKILPQKRTIEQTKFDSWNTVVEAYNAETCVSYWMKNLSLTSFAVQKIALQKYTSIKLDLLREKFTGFQ